MRGRGRTGPERGLHKVGGKRRSPKVSCESFLPLNQVRGRSLATAPAGTFLPPSMDRDSHSEDTLSTMVLENIKNKLIHAFRTTGESRVEAPGSGPPVRPLSAGRSHQANEELRRAQIDGAITWLRSELLEMRSQDVQLAQTLLGLNTEIQRLRRESVGGAEAEGGEQR